MKALVLYSGGLDSNLALKLILDQGLQALALTFFTPFTSPKLIAPPLPGVEYIEIIFGENYIKLVRAPSYGWGKNMNPCIDCRIYTLKRAKEIMDEVGASFIVTGEVLSQRPMSQRRDTFRLIEREAELEGLILRPLSAKLLPPTIPERAGWVRREALLGLRGRSRKLQMEMARRRGIEGYPSPAGGCRLTDPGFSHRLREALSFGEDSLRDMELLKLGRHFRFPSGGKAIVGRNEEENGKLSSLASSDDYLLEVVSSPGPLTLLWRGKGEEDLRAAASLCARYSDGEGDLEVRTWREGDGVRLLKVSPLEEEKILEYRIG